MMVKICYFIQTHQNPDQIYRLIRTIKRSSPHAQILINQNFNRCELDLTPLQDLSDIHLLDNQEYLIRYWDIFADGIPWNQDKGVGKRHCRLLKVSLQFMGVGIGHCRLLKAPPNVRKKEK